jgi:hypothetical protein
MYRTRAEFDSSIHFSQNDSRLVMEICEEIREASGVG